VFLTDNGGTAGVSVFNAGMRGRKIELYEGGHRVPCFIRWPSGKLRPPGDVAELTQVQDLTPTLLELCGIGRPEGVRFDGLSLGGLLSGTEDRLPDRKLVIQFSRMNAPVPRQGDACVLWKQWRLVNSEELYDVASDPQQQRNVAEAHPEVAGQLKRHYDEWWEGVAPDVNRFSRIVIGSAAEPRSLLSPCEWADVFLDQMAQVRRGERKNGVWHLEVERDGKYEVVLRRWPAEADLPITAASPEYRGTGGVYPAGAALPVAAARVAVADFDQTIAVGADQAQAASFQVTLARGPVELQTWFYNRDGNEICGAYFVYVQRQ
jgi:arylsulfatase